MHSKLKFLFDWWDINRRTYVLQYLQKKFCNDKKKLKSHDKCKKNINECKNHVLDCKKNCNWTDWREKSDGIYVLQLS